MNHYMKVHIHKNWQNKRLVIFWNIFALTSSFHSQSLNAMHDCQKNRNYKVAGHLIAQDKMY
jgi:hypothetical protein